ncbi:MerR family transcriptional regulator [Candidatus Enterococcus ikei]|uniref:MerR family transcriptional regulator n=1 Tax=Candidatus Enterococcus ikei TaxID=2815326 RepID=A0ABS3H0Y9_9ENTE|nr:MerR family transcriptional regulator [Enterococcus sp. DIV0869a]MBO0441199.1 MerR family transcriptional regulator [Enterococcus sp. DIV0869a]
MFKISEFSELTNISPRMLRHYDKLNLLKPKITKKDNGYRYYTPEQINQANRILSLKNVGIPLKEIAMLLDNPVEQTNYLTTHRKKLETELAEKKLQLAYLDWLEEKKTTSTIEAVNHPVETKNMNDMFVLTYREKVASYYQEEQLWQKLFAGIKTEDLPALSRSMAVFHNDSSEIIDIEVMITIPEKLKTIYPTAKFFSPGLIASVVTSGAYSTMPKVHEDMREWLRLNEYVLAGDIFTIYHSSPATEEREELYITEVCYPIK